MFGGAPGFDPPPERAADGAFGTLVLVNKPEPEDSEAGAVEEVARRAHAARDAHCLARTRLPPMEPQDPHPSSISLMSVLHPMADLLKAAACKGRLLIHSAAVLREYLELYGGGISEDDDVMAWQAICALTDIAAKARLAPTSWRPRDVQLRMDRAADYTDEWFWVGAGNNAVSFRSYFMCGRVIGDTLCTTVTLASHWLRHYADPLADGQRWYCPICESRYEQSNGVLVEFLAEGRPHFVLAPYPPVEFREIKWASTK